MTKSSKEQGVDKAWRYVKMNNITRDNRFDISSFTTVDAADEEVGKFSLMDGDFLFNTSYSRFEPIEFSISSQPTSAGLFFTRQRINLA